jgi:DNA invertase Pin-like site-specific DNA recombinase
MKTPHQPATVAAVRLLYERSTHTYAEIARETGVSQASVSRYARAGGWQRPPGAPKATTSANGLPSPWLKGRMLARRLRDICARYLDHIEHQPDPRDMPDCGAVLAMLRMAKEEERRKPRRPLAARARAVAERYLDQLERDPEPDPEALAWVLMMLKAAREEEAMARRRPPSRPIRDPRVTYARGNETD